VSYSYSELNTIFGAIAGSSGIQLNIQGDQKVSVHMMITVQKHSKIFETVSITYHDNVVIIRDNRWR
jgi:hypothetical protein